jgi:peroxiredoxin
VVNNIFLVPVCPVWEGMTKMYKTFTTTLMIFGLLVSLAGCGDEKKQASLSTGLMKGQLAPDFTLKDLNGKEFSLSAYRNKDAVYLVFWATWCPYCIRDIPRIKEIHSKYSSKGLKIISVNIAANDPIGRVMAFQKKYKLPYPILYDENNIVSRMYGIMGVPVSIIIDRKGIIQFRGYTLPKNVEQLFAQVL